MIRLILPDVLLPTTTALGTVDVFGREKGLLAEANVVMPNLSPTDVRGKYLLYDNKICTVDDAAECIRYVEPVREMEKVLFAADELTGLIWAAALMRPSKSTKDMELKSLKKKYKSKGFAAGCSREVIDRGADQLGWELDRLLEMTLQAMAASEDIINAEMQAEQLRND